ncbi:MAG TPA: bifunctional glycosyltransferase family 2/GtrA family protein [Bryobacteraceae bacterium]
MPPNPEDAERLAVVIPAYRPSAGLVDLVCALSQGASPPIVIVDDGSGPEYRDIFIRAAAFPGVQILRHAVNLGKGAALKTAINHLLCTVPGLAGIVTADADGQHHPHDIQRVADALLAHPQSLILGSRHFDKEVPLRSRIGNIATRAIMHALLGQKLTDTQTGLRGIPASFLPQLLKHEATGYEFELEMLISAHKQSIPMLEVPIRTIYEPGNKSSHFNPVTDSMKIYFVLLRFGSVSVLSGLLDSLVYILVWNRTRNALMAQVVGRVVSVCFNYSMVRTSVFSSHQRHKSVLPKYLALVGASGTASYGGIHFLYHSFGVPPITAKLVVETTLFFVNFAVQRLFIFKSQERAQRAQDGRTASGQPRTFPVRGLAIAAGVVFAALVGVEIYGLANVHLWTQDIWAPVGLKRFIRFGGVYLAVAVPLLVMVPWTFATVVAVLPLVLTAIAVGPQAVFAVAFFLVSSWALGFLLLGRGKTAIATPSLPLDICATLLGMGIYVLLMTLVARVPVNYPAAWAVLLAVPVALDFRGVGRRLAYWSVRVRDAELRCGWQRAACALLVFLLAAHWLIVLKPEVGADALGMHLAIAMDIAAHHAMTFQPAHYLWAVMPMGADWAYSIVYLLGGEYATRLFNFAMLLAVVGLIYGVSRRWVSPAVSLLLAASFAATPVVQLVTGALFVENFLTAMLLVFMVAVWHFGDTGEKKFLYMAAVAAGTAVTTKYGALLFLALALPFVILEIVRNWKRLEPRPLAACALALFLLLGTALPSYAIAYQKTGNPIFPFLNPRIHSPLLDPKVEILDVRFQMPADWKTLYSLTFHTSRSYEGQDGSFGFQYLIVAPLVLLGLVLVRQRQASSAAVLALGAGVLLMRSATPNVRYLYAAMPLAMISFAAFLGWIRASQRWVFRALIVYLAASTALNAWFLPASSYYHKDFCLRLPFSRAERKSYMSLGAPIRVVIDWYNQHHPDSTVLLATDNAIAGLSGRVYENHWHQYATFEAMERATTLPQMLELLKSWKVDWIIATRPDPGDPPLAAPLQNLLDTCTQREYESAGTYLAHLDPDCKPKPGPEIVVSQGLYDDFDPAIQFRGGWERDKQFAGPYHHSISYTDTAGAQATLIFQGTSFTYVFTKAPNRGIAAVNVDGADQGTVDLYSPKVEWQSRKNFCCFARGRHVIEISVTGRKDARSTGRYIDLDSIQVW